MAVTNKILQIKPEDNVAVALMDLNKGEVVRWGSLELTCLDDIPAGHKLAVAEIAAGGRVIKYGEAIGAASCLIHPGEAVHSHNLKTRLSGKAEYTWTPNPAVAAADQTAVPQTFRGFRRAVGGVGIRNEIWIVPTVGCVNHTARRIAEQARQRCQEAGLDGIISLEHPYGCSQLGDDLANTRKMLAACIRHPNAGAVLVLGLGCENNHIATIQAELGSWDDSRVKFLNAQDSVDELADACRIVDGFIELLRQDVRSDCPLAELRVGLKCGGSDAFSGITANPLLGRFSDRFLADGGTAVLTEVPEMFGAEHLLMARAKDRPVFGEIVALINNFKDYFTAHRQPVYENPSPGNKAGGITTLEEKSLGCVQKGGVSPIAGVIAYGERLPGNTVPAGEATRAGGLYLLNAPGNDIVAVSALAAAGCQIILFTTGRGTPLGAPVPVLKVASNSVMADKKAAWIDFDAGQLLDGSDSLDQAAAALLALVLQVAEGQPTRSEAQGYRDFAIFKDGVTL